MSVCYWNITGYGVCLDDILALLDAEKLRSEMVRQEKCELEPSHPDWQVFKEMDNDSRMEYLGDDFCEYTSNICGVLAESDALELLSSATNGDGMYFLLYERRYPWEMRIGECQRQEEALQHICKLLLSFTLPEITADELSKLIYEIDATGCG
jgi:hypothetical protein